MTRLRPWSALALAVAPLFGPAVAQQGPVAPDRRAEIAAERAAVGRRYAEQQRACQQRFAVTGCVNAARDERRAALVPLRQEELRIDTEDRKQRAAARLGEIEAKQRADAARDAGSAPPSGRFTAGPQGPARPAERIGGGSPKPTIGAEERARREAESQEKFERRQADAARHRAEVEARNAERTAKGKMAKPLPAAPAASDP